MTCRTVSGSGQPQGTLPPYDHGTDARGQIRTPILRPLGPPLFPRRGIKGRQPYSHSATFFFIISRPALHPSPFPETAGILPRRGRRWFLRRTFAAELPFLLHRRLRQVVGSPAAVLGGLITAPFKSRLAGGFYGVGCPWRT